MSKTRSRRLRKKLFLGEFRELGFEIDLAFGDVTEEAAVDAFFDRFFSEAVMPQGLVYAGWADAGFVCSSQRGSVTEAQREAVSAWLEQQSMLSSVRVGPLMDVWHA